MPPSEESTEAGQKRTTADTSAIGEAARNVDRSVSLLTRLL